MKKYILIIIIFSLLSCEKTEIEIENENVYLDTGVDAIYFNSLGQNMLDSNTLGSFIFDNIKQYYLDEGKKIEIYDSTILTEYPRDIYLHEQNDTLILRILTHVSSEKFLYEKDGLKYGETITYLKLTDEITDTIKTEWSFGQLTTNTKIWYNGVLYQDNENHIWNRIIIVK
ncbi:MAG: hypothetical protein KAI79_14080 [Bacteroidales bacterium]|nr:hypothetical protein [Bacteroidales bacterium]